jgi:hypothetical protein
MLMSKELEMKTFHTLVALGESKRRLFLAESRKSLENPKFGVKVSSILWTMKLRWLLDHEGLLATLQWFLR